MRLWTHILAVLLLVGCAKGDTPAEQRSHIQQMRQQTLSILYGQDGVLRDNGTGRDTYMELATAGMGIGMGIKKFQAVIIFNDAAALDRFITTGFDASAQADLAAKSAEDGKVGVSEAANADFQSAGDGGQPDRSVD